MLDEARLSSMVYEALLEHLRRRYLRRPGIRVHSLVVCTMRARFEEQYPEFSLQRASLIQRIVIGELIHVGLEHILSLRGARTEVEFRREIEVDGRRYLIIGTPDLVIGGAVADIKFSLAKPEELPHEHHVDQVKIYMWLAKAARGFLIYVTPSALRVIRIDEPMDEVSIKMRVKEYLENSRHPRYEWECKHCVFASICPYASPGRQH